MAAHAVHSVHSSASAVRPPRVVAVHLPRLVPALVVVLVPALVVLVPALVVLVPALVVVVVPALVVLVPGVLVPALVVPAPVLVVLVPALVVCLVYNDWHRIASQPRQLACFIFVLCIKHSITVPNIPTGIVTTKPWTWCTNRPATTRRMTHRARSTAQKPSRTVKSTSI